MNRIQKILNDEPATEYFVKGKLVGADYNVPNNLKGKINALIKEHKLK